MERSWVTSANSADNDFPLANLPYGVFATGGEKPRCGIAIGDKVLDLSVLAAAGILHADCGFADGELNTFMSKGAEVWAETRARVTDLLAESGSGELRKDPDLSDRALLPMKSVQMRLPFRVTGYTDFYAGRQHAFNSGSILRGPENALTPNWSHMPIGYNGRTSTVVVSGTPVRRPLGQILLPGSDVPNLSASRRLDIEVEFGAVVGIPTEMGQTLSVAEAWEHLFGFVLLNDWSARDIQRWEGQPLGPFQSKAFATTVSPWVVTRAALEPFRSKGWPRDQTLLPYLDETEDYFFDLQLEAHLEAKGTATSRVVQTNTKHLYYSAPQLLAHHALCGCRMESGDLLGSGTISGPERGSFGCLMEQTWGGRDPVELTDGGTRLFLEDGDIVTLTGWGQADDYRIGFGRCEGQILPAPTKVGAI